MGPFSKTRVETFSDGIFAIIVTLLVLEIKVPHLAPQAGMKELADQLHHLVPKFLSWVISFFTVCVIWINHHRVFDAVEKVSGGFFWLNALLLLWCSFVPFPTALMGDYPQNPLAVSLYGAVMALMALSFFFMRMNLYHAGQKSSRMAALARQSLLFGFVPYAVAAGLAWVSPGVAMFIYFAIPVYFAWPRRAHA